MTVTQFKPRSIRLTKAAAKHIADFLGKNPNAIGLRLGVKDAGCSSKKYVTDYVEHQQAKDTVFHDKNITLFVAAEDLPFVAGTEIDYVQNGLNHMLKFNNPNVTSECGCGESFNIN